MKCAPAVFHRGIERMIPARAALVCRPLPANLYVTIAGRRTDASPAAGMSWAAGRSTGGVMSISGGRKFYQILYFQVLIAILLGACVGFFFPAFGASLKPLGDGFIKLIKMLIAPIIFLTVVIGIAGMEDMKKLGRVGLR